MKRVKRRYLELKLECEGLPNEREIIDAIWAAVTKLYGEVGASQTGLALINFNEESKVAVIRVSLSALNSLRASVATIGSIDGKEASFHVLGVSGTLKGLNSAKNN